MFTKILEDIIIYKIVKINYLLYDIYFAMNCTNRKFLFFFIFLKTLKSNQSYEKCFKYDELHHISTAKTVILIHQLGRTSALGSVTNCGWII